ncbi:MAG: preprotein translocase subunit SecD [Methanomicrobiales archaeon]|jgi:preprotein translocase subunit SecD|nr:preprotein translocase subunit SecD [Methanomicrobiales archaeon]
MDIEKYIEVIKDYRVLVLIILLILSVIAIGPHFEKGQLTTNLKYGLDLDGGAWIQLEFQGEIVTFEMDRWSNLGAVDEFVTTLSERLEADVILVEQNTLEIRKSVPEEELRALFDELGVRLVSYNPGISKSTANDVKRVLENKVNSLGNRDAKVYTVVGLNNVARYIRVELAGVSMAEAQEIVGKQGKFELRIQTSGDILNPVTEHVLFGDVISGVQNPSQNPPNSNQWGVSFTLSEIGAKQFQTGAIAYGAVSDPNNHYLIMYLDGEIVYSAPLSHELATDLSVRPSNSLVASTGFGEEGRNAAQVLEIHLRNGALPVDVKIAGSGSMSAELGEQFKFWCVIAGLFALLAVTIAVYFRYREPSIMLPMVIINASEILILLGFASIAMQLDLATIAGLIAVLGSGIDQLVIITDEILHEGKVPSPTIYLKRLKRALGIIIASATTTVIAMLPLALMDLSTLRGFAIISILGVIVGVVITRPAYGRIIMAILSK